MLHAVIMAGGAGTRFWPESRRAQPKQLLNLAGEQTMIRSTCERLDGVIPHQRIRVLTNATLVDAVAQQLPMLPIENVVGEPAKRDTAPCVGLAAALIAAEDPDAIMLMMPSDHVIQDVAGFQNAVQAGAALIEADPKRIVTFGIKPDYPAESFGYIERGDAIEGTQSGFNAFDVNRFREKPDATTAKQYLDAGTFYWNAGIFLWRADTILSALRAGAPEICKHIDAISAAIGKDNYQQVLQEEFTAIKGTSIDYAVMESYDSVVVIEAPFDWDDVGSWQAIARLHPSDDANNTVVGSHLPIDSNGCIIRTRDGHTVVTIDVDDLIVVQTPDATLVAPKSSEERVREAVKRLEQQGKDNLL